MRGDGKLPHHSLSEVGDSYLLLVWFLSFQPTRIKGVLEGHIFLQIVSIRDVGSSFYSQLRHLEGSTNTNSEVSAETVPEERNTVIRGQRLVGIDRLSGDSLVRMRLILS